MNKNKFVKVRLSQDAYNKLRQWASKYGDNMSSFVRRLIDSLPSKLPTVQPPITSKPMITEQEQEQEQAIDGILRLLGDKEATTKNILAAGQAHMRKIIYRDYPSSDPKIVEALLLMYANVCLGLFTEIEIKAETEEVGKQLTEEMKRFGSALNKTIKTLASL